MGLPHPGWIKGPESVKPEGLFINSGRKNINPDGLNLLLFPIFTVYDEAAAYNNYYALYRFPDLCGQR